jgi:cell division septation protein DedD
LKPTAAHIEKETPGWKLSWQPVGQCSSFTRESILACAPPSSGVYGLVNLDRQIFIGQSANIREALLRHDSETDFQHSRPTGFAFELCAPELRKLWATELISKFKPLLQKEVALAESESSLNDPLLSEPDQDDWKLGTDADHQDFPLREREERPKVRRRFQPKRTHTVGSASILVATAAIILYLSLPGDYGMHKRANSANPMSSPAAISSKPHNVTLNDTAARPVNQNARTNPVTASTSAWNNSVHLSEKSSGANELSVQTKASSDIDSALSPNLRKKWSVQISASPTKDLADNFVQQLKAKGYDAYVVEANVKDQTYYRVRVGRFDKREEAESMRLSVTRQEGYRDAYLAND